MQPPEHWLTHVSEGMVREKKKSMRTRKQERYNNEDKHTSGLNVSTEHKWVQVHDMKSMDLSQCCVTLRAIVKHMHTLDYDMQENERNKDNLHHAHVLPM